MLATLTGVTGTIAHGTSSKTVATVHYTKAETITLTASRTSGDSLSTSPASSSIAFTAGALSDFLVEAQGGDPRQPALGPGLQRPSGRPAGGCPRPLRHLCHASRAHRLPDALGPPAAPGEARLERRPGRPSGSPARSGGRLRKRPHRQSQSAERSEKEVNRNQDVIRPARTSRLRGTSDKESF